MSRGSYHGMGVEKFCVSHGMDPEANCASAVSWRDSIKRIIRPAAAYINVPEAAVIVLIADAGAACAIVHCSSFKRRRTPYRQCSFSQPRCRCRLLRSCDGYFAIVCGLIWFLDPTLLRTISRLHSARNHGNAPLCCPLSHFRCWQLVRLLVRTF